MIMPKLKPIPIKTKNHSILTKYYRWATYIRIWEVSEDWEFKLHNKTLIIIPKGFKFDGASIPKPLWFLLSPTGLLLIPGLIHDFGYRYNYLWSKDDKDNYIKIYENYDQEFWDILFRKESLRVNGIAAIGFSAWLSLVFFGRFAWNKNRKRNAKDISPKI